MAALEITFGALAVISLGITAWQHVVSRRANLHRRAKVEGDLPPVTLLKPLKDTDQHTFDCLNSWLQQNYPARVQVLCAAASADDPVCAVVETLQKLHPDADLQLFICSEHAAANPKVSKLIQLEPHIAHSVVVVSDADVWVERDYLAQAVSTLQREEAGLVNSFYRMPAPASVPTALETIGTNCDMWTQVLQADSMRELNFALGAAMTLKRETIAAIGGFTAIGDHLADDNRLGLLVQRASGRIVFTDVVVECRSEPMNWGRFWRHQVRWNATIRACEPLPYFFSLIANLTLWASLWVVAASGSLVAWSGWGVCLVVRVATATAHWRKLCQRPMSSKHLLLIPIKDLLQVGLWAAAFLTSTVTWRGNRYRICHGGKLEPVPAKAKPD